MHNEKPEEKRANVILPVIENLILFMAEMRMICTQLNHNNSIETYTYILHLLHN